MLIEHSGVVNWHVAFEVGDILDGGLVFILEQKVHVFNLAVARSPVEWGEASFLVLNVWIGSKLE